MFQKYLINQISTLLKELRLNKGQIQNKNLSQNELAFEFNYKTYGQKYDPKVDYNGRTDINRIEKGKIAKKNTSLITENMVKKYSDTFSLSREEIIFGGEKGIDEFCEHIFLVCAYNFYYENSDMEKESFYKIISWPQLQVNDIKLFEIHSNIIELMYFNSSFVLANTKIEFENFSLFDFLYNNYNYAVNYVELYDDTVKQTWKLVKKIFIESFKTNIVRKEVRMSCLDSEIIKWLNNDMIKLIKDFISEYLKKDEIYKIGYEVFDIELEKFDTFKRLNIYSPNNLTLRQSKNYVEKYSEIYKESYKNVTSVLVNMQTALFSLQDSLD